LRALPGSIPANCFADVSERNGSTRGVKSVTVTPEAEASSSMVDVLARIPGETDPTVELDAERRAAA